MDGTDPKRMDADVLSVEGPRRQLQLVKCCAGRQRPESSRIDNCFVSDGALLLLSKHCWASMAFTQANHGLFVRSYLA